MIGLAHLTPYLPTWFSPVPRVLPPYHADVHYWKDDGTVTAGALASEIDQYPYVSITISTGD